MILSDYDKTILKTIAAHERIDGLYLPGKVGSRYTSLKRLRRNGLITSVNGSRLSENGPYRQIYMLTEKGKELDV